jgi:4-hydroxybenzoate polyprenyltransferase
MSAAPSSPLPPLLRAMRPEQWTKNGVVGAAYIFAVADAQQQIGLLSGALLAAGAIIAFCLVSSAVYLLNDIRDREADAQHPTKKDRPIAAGTLSPRAATVAAIILLHIGILGGSLLNPAFAAALVVYVLIQAAYTLVLKQVALVDVFIIAIGFVLRAIAGALVLDAAISPWLLLCTFLLAMLLGLCKRRHEMRLTATPTTDTRKALSAYDERLTDQLIGIASSSTIVAYAIYTLSQDTIEKFGTTNLGFTIPFVMFGIFRYLDLVYRNEEGGHPERLLLHDRPLQACIMLYGLATIAILGRAFYL